MDVVVTCICDSSADEIKPMRPGSNMVETYALLNPTQRNEIAQYLRNPEKRNKWKLWSFINPYGKGDADMEKSPRMIHVLQR